jgi:hypothetical protein
MGDQCSTLIDSMNPISQGCAREHVCAGDLSFSLGDTGIAVDYYFLAYRTEIARMVAEMACTRYRQLRLNVPWSYEDEWAGWALRSFHHRAQREGFSATRIFADIAPGQRGYELQGEYWRDWAERPGKRVRMIMPDAFAYVLEELARSTIIRRLSAGLLKALCAVGANTHAVRHQRVFDSMREIRG